MKIALRVARALVGITGGLQLVIGVLFWTGHALSLVGLHMALGGVFTLSLLALAVLAARAGAPRALAVVTFVWGLLLPVLGMTQMQLFPGAGHWVIRTLHLVTGIVAMALGGALTARARLHSQVVPANPEAQPTA